MNLEKRKIRGVRKIVVTPRLKTRLNDGMIELFVGAALISFTCAFHSRYFNGTKKQILLVYLKLNQKTAVEFQGLRD